MTDLKSQIQSLIDSQSSSSDQQQKLVDLQHSLDRLREENSSLNQQLLSSSAELSQILAASQSEVQNLQKSLATAESNYNSSSSELQQQLLSLQSQVSAAESSSRQHQQQAEQLQQQVSSLQLQNAKDQAALSSSLEIRQQQEGLNQSLQSRVTELQSQLEQEQTHSRELESEREKDKIIRRRLQEKEQLVVELTSQLAMMSESQAQLEQSSWSEGDQQRMRQEFDEKVRAMEITHVTEAETLKQHIWDLESRVNEHHRELTEAQQKLAGLREKNKSLVAALREHEGLLETRTTERDSLSQQLDVSFLRFCSLNTHP